MHSGVHRTPGRHPPARRFTTHRLVASLTRDGLPLPKRSAGHTLRRRKGARIPQYRRGAERCSRSGQCRHPAPRPPRAPGPPETGCLSGRFPDSQTSQEDLGMRGGRGVVCLWPPLVATDQSATYRGGRAECGTKSVYALNPPVGLAAESTSQSFAPSAFSTRPVQVSVEKTAAVVADDGSCANTSAIYSPGGGRALCPPPWLVTRVHARTRFDLDVAMCRISARLMWLQP
ncbi:hypothetical protein BD413DRAFT_257952 [Trametes elegans]|nr:hypothetical protein BD413DRAFT_257952 [Trametes elegans]